jgi:hypothetical protein
LEKRLEKLDCEEVERQSCGNHLDGIADRFANYFLKPEGIR